MQRREHDRGAQPKAAPERLTAAASLVSAPRVAAQRAQIQAAFGPAIERQDGPAVPEKNDLVPGGFATIQRQPDGKEVVDDLTKPDWESPGRRETTTGTRPITGAELKIMLRGAAIAAWNTYAYHATKSANVPSITTEGLDPGRGGTGAAAGSEVFEEHSRGHVHYTRNRGLAEDYQGHFEGHTPFGRKDPSPAPAEVLQVAIPRDVAAHEEVDPDSKGYDRAFRTTARVPGRFIRSTKAVPLPSPREGQRRGRAEPLVPGANKGAWLDHLDRTFAETDALLSNMPSSATNVLWDIMKRGLDINVVLQTLNQALRSMSVDAILDFTKEDRAANPRVAQGRMDATGVLLPLKRE
jgi:hypothetical protein